MLNDAFVDEAQKVVLEKNNFDFQLKPNFSSVSQPICPAKLYKANNLSLITKDTYWKTSYNWKPAERGFEEIQMIFLKKIELDYQEE